MNSLFPRQQTDASVISIHVIDHHGGSLQLDCVRSNQPLLEVAIRLDPRLQAAQQASASTTVPTTQQQRQPEVDLMSVNGETLALSQTPSAYALIDGSSIYCYRYGEACRDHRRRLTAAAVAAASAAAAARQAEAAPCGISDNDGDTSPDLANPSPIARPAVGSAIPKLPSPPQFVGLYLSDWLCGYTRRLLLHHDLAMPFEVLLRPYCAMRGMRLEEVSWVWLQFYRKVRMHGGEGIITWL